MPPLCKGPIPPQCGVIPLLGEMSRSDKRVPVSGGKMSQSDKGGRPRCGVTKWRRDCLYRWALSKDSVSFPLKPRRLILLSRSTKVCKNALLVPAVRKRLNCRAGLIWLFLSTVFCSPFTKSQDNTYRQFNISPLCHSSALFRSAQFKTGVDKGYRYFISVYIISTRLMHLFLL